ncbi:MAG TPA: sulfatase-like hydrolase/transferase [Solirubrobacteraceae bacterium]|nr:sulfatase-like hydrolase/transferase [Solirubrobacteraceae bacterium]
MKKGEPGDIGPEQNRHLTRRRFLKGGLLAAGAIAGGDAIIRATAGASDQAAPTPPSEPIAAHGAVPGPTTRPPNILVILVDQMRYPQWLTPTAFLGGLPPNVARLRRGSVSFAHHYTVSNDCTPSRSALLTGLYTHQTGCMITGGSTLDHGFPTWGTMLREHGYRTRWYGKWHLTHRDNHWTSLDGEPALERYGFAGGTFPSPDGGPGQGWKVDPQVSAQFIEWLQAEGRQEPWCTTVSFVNPHDIAWWYVWSNRVPDEVFAPPELGRLPPNYETPELLLDRRKPQLQRSLQATAATSFGPVPFHGPESLEKWLAFQNLYVKLQLEVDRHIGSVLAALESNPSVAENTVVVFTSDHGEYGGSHGLRGKGASAYEEAIRVPLMVRDPRGLLTAATEQERTQLTSSVDLAPLLLTIASGGSAWRREHRYAHLARRLDISSILADPSAPGRSFVLHATDETVTEFAIEPYAAAAPLHVTAIRTPRAKFATYDHWEYQSIEPISRGTEVELYDYSTQEGRLELENSAGRSPIEESLRSQLSSAINEELREPLPHPLADAHIRGFADYFSTARHAALGAAARRKLRSERLVGHLPPGDTGGAHRH